jgi:hypothetical protein
VTTKHIKTDLVCRLTRIIITPTFVSAESSNINGNFFGNLMSTLEVFECEGRDGGQCPLKQS